MPKKILPLFCLILIVSVFSLIYIFPKNKQPDTKTTILSAENSVTTKTEPMPDIFYAPVLVYHHIAPNKNNSEHYVTPEMFEKQMAWLKDNNYNVVTYRQLYDALTDNYHLPEKPVLITFDDGDKDQYENALPILKKYNYPAIFFIETITVGKSQWMSWEMIRDLLNSGMEIGSHTITHYNLPKQTQDVIKYEVTESKRILEEKLNTTIDFFAYPNGTYSQNVIDELINAGYKSAVTIRYGTMQNKKESAYTIPRIYVTDNLEYFINRIQKEK